MLASGSFKHWSPITPGFTQTTDYVSFTVAKVARDAQDGGWRPIGLARVDHDGGARVYRLDFTPGSGVQLRLQALEDAARDVPTDWILPGLFQGV